MYRFVTALVVVILVCSGAYIGLRVEHRAAKDRRDLGELTSSSPWPRDELIVPDDLPRGALGWLDRTGFDVSFDLAVGAGRRVPVRWQLHQPDPDGRLAEGVDCAAVAVVTCTELGAGFRLAVTRDTDNSDPSVALYRLVDGRVLSVTVQGPDQVSVDELRPALVRIHRPTDAELLALLRRRGYQTDWS